MEYRHGGICEMMHYNDDTLSVLIAALGTEQGSANELGESSIVLLSTIPNLSDQARIIKTVPTGIVADSVKLFVRHTSDYLYFGLHNERGRDNHRKWMIKGCSLDPNKSEKEIGMNPPLVLEDFHGNDIGSTVAFEIHDGYFYAVSNQGTYEVEEVDWTSFYHCVKFPLDNNIEDAVERDSRVYRRQHAEGAIHDSWTDLTLQHDEKTNELYIVESRREWLGSTSKQARTFYTSRIQFPSLEDSLLDLDPFTSSAAQPRPLPDNDILTTLLDSSHNANYMPTPEQYSWTRHPEFPIYDRSPFTLATTKFRAYSYSCSTFVDLVEDDKCCPDRLPSARPCLRLRMGSRRIAPSDTMVLQDRKGKAPVKHDNPTGLSAGEHTPFVDSTRYRYSDINMWPPPSSTCPCAARSHDIMNPVFLSEPTWGRRSIQAISDERSIVYMVKPSGDNADSALGTIVHIDFGRSNADLQSGSHLRWERKTGQEAKCRSGTCAQALSEDVTV
ncbi:hypothetical protein E8E11_006303 [Didymella keratinophila]|nr:hypothetical protein E8E11_006303 [Didymella keratinophila]